MTHRIEVNLETGEIKQIDYTPEEQAAYDAAVATQVATEQAAQLTNQSVITTEA